MTRAQSIEGVCTPRLAGVDPRPPESTSSSRATCGSSSKNRSSSVSPARTWSAQPSAPVVRIGGSCPRAFETPLERLHQAIVEVVEELVEGASRDSCCRSRPSRQWSVPAGFLVGERRDRRGEPTALGGCNLIAWERSNALAAAAASCSTWTAHAVDRVFPTRVGGRGKARCVLVIAPPGARLVPVLNAYDIQSDARMSVKENDVSASGHPMAIGRCKLWPLWTLGIGRGS